MLESNPATTRETVANTDANMQGRAENGARHKRTFHRKVRTGCITYK